MGGIMSQLLSWMGGYIVLRQEVLFTDALSNIGFLGIALAILFNLPITPMLIGICILAAFLIRFLQSKKIFSNDSLLETFARIGLALGVIVIALFPGYRVNIEQFLFGDILGISQFDTNLAVGIFIIFGTMILLFHKRFLQISLSDTLSHTLVKHKTFYHALLIFAIATLIAMAIKIIGALLVGAFIAIPPNTVKLLAKNIKQTFILSSILGLLATLVGLYLSTLFNLPTGPLVVTTLGAFWLLSIIINLTNFKN